MARRRKDFVTIICYGQLETMERNDAMEKYMDCIRHSEGHERNRYFNIVSDLTEGKAVCSDRDGNY